MLKPGHTEVTAKAPVGSETGHVTTDCRPVADILARVGDKWTVFVIRVLDKGGATRFNEMRRQIHGISQRMLTMTLRGLERDGLVSRKIYPTIPPKVEYELTELGRSLSVPVNALGAWAFEHQPCIEAARAKFDKANALER